MQTWRITVVSVYIYIFIYIYVYLHSHIHCYIVHIYKQAYAHMKIVAYGISHLLLLFSSEFHTCMHTYVCAAGRTLMLKQQQHQQYRMSYVKQKEL